MLLVTLAILSASAFFYYGGETLFANPPRIEYKRYGMAKLRIMVGSLQILGAIGLLTGLFVAPLGAAAAAGLALMMVLGVAARQRIHDAPRLMIPASSLAILNTALVYLFVTH
ncbi:MAG: hypothetical protein ACJAR2_000900 [Ilumatobacter sp.]|jgi:hypothetical protein